MSTQNHCDCINFQSFRDGDECLRDGERVFPGTGICPFFNPVTYSTLYPQKGKADD